MKTTLMKYQTLSVLQHQQLQQIELQPAQKTFVGDIYGALHGLTARPLSDLQAYVLLVEEVPRGFFLLKRGSLLPPWAQGQTATLHALMIDRRYQRLGLGESCVRRLPGLVAELWPDIVQVMLAVHPANHAAAALYQALGWTYRDDEAGSTEHDERRMVLTLR